MTIKMYEKEGRGSENERERESEGGREGGREESKTQSCAAVASLEAMLHRDKSQAILM